MITPFAGRIVWHATSEQEKENIRAVYPRSSVAVIPNGIDLSEFDDHEDISRERYFSRFARGSCSPTHIVISMGRLHKKKGFDILIDSFDSIKTEFPGVVFLIAGPDGGEGEALRSQIKRLNLHDRVFLIGEIQGKDKVDFLANADLFALPSHDENFGNVYAESLAAGTPIVASTNTPWAEIERFNCGKWISNNITTTAVAMRDMLNADLETMGRNGKRFVTDNYSWSSVVSRFDRVFKELKDRNKVE
jgi:glycosyltransferase involved in cell wall biosynthesis